MFDDGLSWSELTDVLKQSRRKNFLYSLCRLDCVKLRGKTLNLEPGVRLIDYDKITDRDGLKLRGEAPLPENEGIESSGHRLVSPYSLRPSAHGNTSYALVHGVWSRLHLEVRTLVDPNGPDKMANEARAFAHQSRAKLNDSLSMLAASGWKLAAQLTVSRLEHGFPLMMYSALWYEVPGIYELGRQSALDLGSGKLLRKIYNNIDPAKNGALRIAIERLSYARARRMKRDALLDACIGLEALFGGNKSNEGSKEICIRFACLHGSTAKDRQILFHKLRNTFQLRNNVVHGAHFDDSKVGKASDLTIAALSDSLRTILSSDDGFKREHFLRKLDAAVFW